MNDIADRLRRLPVPPVADLDLATAAERSGLLDLATAEMDGPLGPLLLVASNRGLARLAYLDVEDGDEVLADLSRRVSPRILHAPRRLDPVRRALADYLEGRRRDLDVPVDLATLGDFGRAVLEAARTIPYGSVVTYRELAERVGRPSAARAVGNALGANPVPIVVPCHRIVRTGGALGGYVGGLPAKSALLALEGSR